MRLEGNTILITGGSSGIGFELARQFVKLGNSVLITGRNSKKLAVARERLPEVSTYVCDVSKFSEIESLREMVIADFPEINFLINNAGIAKRINLQTANVSFEALTEEIDINLKGPIQFTKAFLPHLKSKDFAAIMYVSSSLAYVPLPISPIYCASKAALHSYSRSIRVPLANTKIKVFELAPPLTQTELVESMDKRDISGVPIMKVEEMVRQTMIGIKKDHNEIRPGQANILYLMNRLVPGFIFKQMSKSVERMLMEPSVDELGRS